MVGVAAFIGTLLLVRRVRLLERYRYTFLSPRRGSRCSCPRSRASAGRSTAPGCGSARRRSTSNRARRRRSCSSSSSPAYLVDKRELLAAGSRRLGRLTLPDPTHLGPLLLAWGFSLLVMVRQKDLGSSLLFFAVFAAMLYIATERARVPHRRAGLFFGGRGGRVPVVRARPGARLDVARTPGRSPADNGYQIVQSLFSFGSGGFAGTGLRARQPAPDPQRATDFVFSAIGEELGLIGTVAILFAVPAVVAAGTASRCRPNGRSRSCSPPASRRSSAFRRS